MMLTTSACEDEDEIRIDYLPLSVGNYWYLEPGDFRVVTRKDSINGKGYYQIRQQMGSSERTLYYRRTLGGEVYRLKNVNSQEYLWLDLEADVNDSWNYIDPDGGQTWTVTLTSKNDTVVINDSILLTRCRAFFFDVAEMADEEYSLWLAPDIGFARTLNAWGFEHVLDSARIAGELIDY